jgi:hypothetical protein
MRPPRRKNDSTAPGRLSQDEITLAKIISCVGRDLEEKFAYSRRRKEPVSAGIFEIWDR